jgi:hypothetical protein
MITMLWMYYILPHILIGKTVTQLSVRPLRRHLKVSALQETNTELMLLTNKVTLQKRKNATSHFLPITYRSVQNGSGAHQASYPMGIRGSFSGDKAAAAWSWPLTSIYCRGQGMRGAVPALPQCAFTAWCSVKKTQGQLYIYLTSMWILNGCLATIRQLWPHIAFCSIKSVFCSHYHTHEAGLPLL